MRTTNKYFVTVCLTVLLGGGLGAAQGEVPVTTSSREALQLYTRAQEKAENLETEAAAGLLEQAIAKDPAFAMAYLLRSQSGGGFAITRENLEKAASLADKVSAGEKDQILAAKAQADGDATAAKQHLDRLLAAYPSDKRVQSLLGFHYRGVLGDNKTAATYFKKATEIDPAFAAAYNNLGYAQSATGDYAGAEATFKKYISLLPDRANPYDSYAELLMKMGRYDDSIVQYKAALARDGAFIGSLAGIGTDLVFKKDYAGGRTWYQQQLAKSTDLNAKLDAMENIAISYVHEGQTVQALKALDEIAELAGKGGLPTRAIGAHTDAAFILLEAGQAVQAEPYVTKASAVAGTSSLPASVKERLGIVSSLLHARVLSMQGKLPEANAVVASTSEIVARRASPLEQHRLNEVQGILALGQKQYAHAVELLSKADQDSPYVIYQQALAAEGAGRTGEASALFKKVAQWNVNDLGYATVRARAMAKTTN